ncbi:methanogen output domain 1-containing protein [Epibacterium sp. Ofav1-8]|uniref:methanogen output domain 1-containing protein n=1 Tax=Epibacterium sp. Ofav1-8 TaxID=2917735 RepID=UPI001EF507C3|nr:methanogen output domain 1-containing protein [Epibacterium sp. Ofav1-8]
MIFTSQVEKCRNILKRILAFNSILGPSVPTILTARNFANDQHQVGNEGLTNDTQKVHAKVVMNAGPKPGIEILMEFDVTIPEPGLDKDNFMRSVIRELAGILEETVGEQEASAYVNHVGLLIGRALNQAYRAACGTERLDPAQVASALVHLKKRIDGGFSIESIDDEAITLVNSACPFGDKVIGRPSLCRMTANVFGHIAAENLGYARVGIEEAIARGDARCRVVVNLKETKDEPQRNETDFFGASI